MNPPPILTRAQALALYQQLQTVNPWLPAAEHLLDEPLELRITPGGHTALTMRAVVECPPGWTVKEAEWTAKKEANR